MSTAKTKFLALFLATTAMGMPAHASISSDRQADFEPIEVEDMSFLVNTVDKLSNQPLHAGEGRTFSVPYKTVIRHAREAAAESGLIVESSSKVDDNTYMVIGKAKASAWSWGELVRIVVINTPDEDVTVRVYTKRRVGINFAAKRNYAVSVFSAIEAKIEFE